MVESLACPKDNEIIKKFLKTSIEMCPACIKLNEDVKKESEMMFYVDEDWKRKNKDKILEFKRAGYLRCKACEDKLTASMEWVKCKRCGKGWSYLLVHGDTDRNRTGEGLCIDCLEEFKKDKQEKPLPEKNTGKEYWNT